MVKRKGVFIIVDEKFFNTFEKERQREQGKLRVKFGNTFNLGQKNFTAILAAKKFKFKFPKQNLAIVVKKRVRRIRKVRKR